MSKYVFTLSPRVKGMIEWQLEHYHESKRQIEQYWADMIPSPTPNYSAEGGGSHYVNRTTETVVERIATSPYIEQTVRSCKAIERVISDLDDTDIKLIDIVYWKRSYTVEGAARILHIDRATAYRHINGILSKIALELGYVSI